MQAYIGMYSLSLHRLASLRKEKPRKSPLKSTQLQSFSAPQQKHHPKKVSHVALLFAYRLFIDIF